jgi:hypothetical protein
MVWIRLKPRTLKITQISYTNLEDLHTHENLFVEVVARKSVPTPAARKQVVDAPAPPASGAAVRPIRRDPGSLATPLRYLWRGFFNNFSMFGLKKFCGYALISVQTRIQHIGRLRKRESGFRSKLFHDKLF